MGNLVSGVVIGLNTKQFQIKNGPRAGQTGLKHYAILVDPQNVQQSICVGFSQPYTVGQQVTLDTEFKYGELQVVKPPKTGAPASSNVIPFTAPVSPHQASASLPPPTPAYTPRGRGPFPIDKGAGEQSIIRQNALTNARELITSMNGRKLEYRHGDESQARRTALDEITEDILYVAYKFAEFSSGQREVRISRERAKVAPQSSVSAAAEAGAVDE